MSGDAGERVAKRIARAGLCSRREAERWIAAGCVCVDGQVLASPGVVVNATSLVTIDGKPLPVAEGTRLWRYHKPPGLVTSHGDPGGRPTVFDSLPDDIPRVISVGRLDIASEGLLLLTNDGALARRLEIPATGWLRRYRVRAFGHVEASCLEALSFGVTVDGVSYGPIMACLERRLGSNAWYTVALREGRNREIRRVMGHLGVAVNRIIRVAFGPFQLGRLPAGQVREVPGKVLSEQLGSDPPATAVQRAKQPAHHRR